MHKSGLDRGHSDLQSAPIPTVLLGLKWPDVFEPMIFRQDRSGLPADPWPSSSFQLYDAPRIFSLALIAALE